MKFDLLKSNLKTIGLGLVMAGGVMLGTSGNLKAQAVMPPDQPGVVRLPRGDRQLPLPDGNAPRPDPLRDGGGDFYQTARELGMRDGQFSVNDDRTRNKRFKPEKAGAYKSGTNGYIKGTVEKDAYKDAYRQGFLRGYERGYRGEDVRAERIAPPPPREDRTEPRRDRDERRRERRPLPPSAQGLAPAPPDAQGQAAPPPDGQPLPPNGQQPPPVRNGRSGRPAPPPVPNGQTPVPPPNSEGPPTVPPAPPQQPNF